MDARTVLKLLADAGWSITSQKGSHIQLTHPDRPGKVTVPAGRKDITPGTLAAIGRQAGIKLR